MSRTINNIKILVFTRLNWFKPIKAFKQKKSISYLKKNAAHLLISTQIEEHCHYNLISKLFLILSNKLSKNRIKITKSKGGLSCIHYNSYKISIERLLITIKKSSVPYTSYQDLSTQSKISKILGNIFFFTYPFEKFIISKTIIIKTKEISIQIIPWFDFVYVEYWVKSDKPIQEGECISIINNKLADININTNEILLKGHRCKDDSTNDIINYLHKSKRKLIGSYFNIPYNPIKLMEYCDDKYDEAKHILNNPQYFKKLFYRYGTEIDKITYQAYEFWNQTKDVKKTWLLAEIWYAIEHENCDSAEDFVFRHTENWMGSKTNIDLIKLTFNELKMNT